MTQALFFIDIGFKFWNHIIWDKQCFNRPETEKYPNAFEHVFVFSKGLASVCNQIKDRKNKKVGVYKKHRRRSKNGNLVSNGTAKVKQGVFGVRTNVWKIPPANKKEDRLHPAPFHPNLPRDLITSWSNPGDLVLDPFLGSGTTAHQAIETGRKFVGIEISEEYCHIARRRIESAKTPLFVY